MKVRTTGFTLIEVLVVVAIIALLISIMLPSLNAARDQARAVACGNNMRQGLQGVMLYKASNNVQKDGWSTNFGWAIFAMKELKGQAGVFTCPSDPLPLPIAAVQDMLVTDTGRLSGTTTGDAVFSRTIRSGVNKWVTDIQDQTDPETYNGTDAYADPAGDLLVKFDAAPGQISVPATLEKGVASWHHNISDYRGRTIARDVTSQVSAQIPLLWLSYGANASAGLKKSKGDTLLIVESGKQGVFPEKLGQYPADHLGWVLRFRHGGRESNAMLHGADWTAGALGRRPATVGTSLEPEFIPSRYQPRIQLNGGFTDGHVERLNYRQLMDVDKLTAHAQRPTPKFKVWFGNRAVSTVSY